MATKLKRFVRAKRTKALAFLLACLSFGAITLLATECVVTGDSGSCNLTDVFLGIRNYTNSSSYQSDLYQAYWETCSAAETFARNPVDEFLFSAEMFYYSFSIDFINPLNGEYVTLKYTNYQGDLETLETAISLDTNYTFNILTLNRVSSITIALRESFIAEKQMNYQLAYNRITGNIIPIFVLIVFVIAMCVVLAAGAGYRSDGEIAVSGVDRLWTEFVLTLFIGLVIAHILFITLLVWSYVHLISVTSNRFLLHLTGALCALGGAAGTATWLPFLLAVVRRIKRRRFFRGTMIWATGRFFRRIFTSQPLVRRTIAVVLVLGLLTMVPFAGILTVPLAVILSVRAVTAILDARDIAIDDEMGKRLKAERLRSELISNVSHDLRTPLTSVITYVDLLKKEPPGSDRVPEYIGIIEAKAQRLKSLTEDLFEASKASSGNIPVDLERIDLVALLTQGLGEMDERIRASGLQFRFSLPGEPLYVTADGKLLWRVMENLVSNALKYSLPGSRVYVEIIDGGDRAGLELKNISNDPLGVSADELTERFVRGDRSRTDGSSGLGLAIAKSLTEAMGGTLELSIDGDLFKARVLCPAVL